MRHMEPKFNEILKAARIRRGLTNDALSRMADISPAMVTRLESGERKPTAEMCIRLANALGEPGNEWLRIAGHPMIIHTRRPKSAVRMQVAA